MDLHDFYLFNATFSQTPVCLSSTVLKWPITVQLLRGDYSSVNMPLEVVQVSGKRWTDILNPFGKFYSVSDRFINILEANAITGWRKFDLSIQDSSGNRVDGYYGLSVVGRSGPIDLGRSQIIEKRLSSNAPLTYFYKGLHIDWTSWDGSDIFMPEETLYVIVSKKLMKLIKGHSLTNIELECLADYEHLMSS